ncbi:MAG: polyprenyl synthetase family protein [Bacteroidota bacterium]|nr:polyprenyl synthetase family protein [Bacteroidota bacterium]
MNRYAEILNDEISIYLQSLPDDGIYLPFKYILNLGGKRFRPSLVLLSTELFGGDIQEAIRPALGIEVFHNFTLVHDDIMDSAPLRRGKKSVHTKWNLNMGILSGDVMFAQANDLISSCYPHHLKEIISLFNKTAIEICEGQDLDMQFENRDRVELEEYIDMIRLKTAVLVGCALKMGAIIGNSNAKDANLMYDFGVNLGTAFQIDDDILDLYGNELAVGKQSGGDIIEGKHSALMILSKKIANPSQLEQLKLFLSYSNVQKKVKDVKALFNSMNVKDAASELKNQYYSKAVKSIELLSIQDAQKKLLLDFAENLMNRKF